jgi:hypothetical protein
MEIGDVMSARPNGILSRQNSRNILKHHQEFIVVDLFVNFLPNSTDQTLFLSRTEHVPACFPHTHTYTHSQTLGWNVGGELIPKLEFSTNLL